MDDILYLVHRIPFPPNKGDKIRSYHFLRMLLEKYRVHLGAFIDDPADRQYYSHLSEMCESVQLIDIHPSWRKIWSVRGLLAGQALGLPYYRHPRMRRWVQETIARQRVRKALIFSSTMAQYVIDRPDLQCYTDFVDVDSDKWRQYADKKNWPANAIYRREARLLLEYERQVATRSRRSFFVSEREADLFRRMAPESGSKVDFVNNGVDTDYFTPKQYYSSPYTNGGPVLVFTGAMDYWANVDAVSWFVREVLAAILQQFPKAHFYIVGSKPSKQVRELGNVKGVHVTGRVEDVRPYLAHADLVVAPLRVARGIQNKVLEALAMDKPVLATEAAMEGIEMSEGMNLSIANDPVGFCTEAIELLENRATGSSSANRQFVIDNFSWTSSGEKLIQALSTDGF